MSFIRVPTSSHVALLVMIAALATLGGAWFIELVLGIKPCHLCLQQRIPYYAGIPVLGIATLLLTRYNQKSGPRKWGRALLVLAALVFLAGAGMGVYHTGVEYMLWSGPTDCTGDIAQNVPLQDFLKQLETVKVIRCDEVPIRIFGLSLAAWNAIISICIATGAAIGAIRKP